MLKQLSADSGEPVCPICTEAEGERQRVLGQSGLFSAQISQSAQMGVTGHRLDQEWVSAPTCGSVPCSSQFLFSSGTQFHLLPRYLMPDGTIPQNTWLALRLTLRVSTRHLSHTSMCTALLLCHMILKPKVISSD